jgi:N-acetylmuramoyl-L-alanine amidase
MGVGTIGTIVGGSRAANGYTWWQVRLSNGTTGWCIENWLVETDGGTTPPPPTRKFQVNDTFRVTSTMNLRSAATTSASVVASMPTGTTGTVTGGPTSANGYIWWNVRLTNGTTGWAAENWMEETDGGTTPPPPSGLPAGTVVRVTEPNLRMRSAGNTSATIVATLPQDARLTIVSGPTSASGYDWYQVTSATAGTGYVADDFIARV